MELRHLSLGNTLTLLEPITYLESWWRGWNKGWEYDWSEGRFNFLEPYDDFDIANLSQYASQNGVGLIGHHETGGNIENYENQLPEAFQFYQRYGIHSVKTGYVTRRPAGEYHQGQFMVPPLPSVWWKWAAAHQIALDITLSQ